MDDVEKNMNQFLTEHPDIIPVNVSAVDRNYILLLYRMAE